MTRDSLHTRYGLKLDKLDDAIYLAEIAGNLSERVTLLRERSQLWYALAKELRDGGKDATGASLAGQRDLYNANRLASGELW